MHLCYLLFKINKAVLIEIFWRDAPFGLWFVWYLLISINMSVVSFFFFLSIENYTINWFLFHMKIYWSWSYIKNRKRGSWQISHFIWFGITLEPPGLMWQVCFVDWSCQQNALEDNKTLEERMVCTWDDGSVTCKVDCIHFGHQNHRRNNSPSLMSLALSYEIAGPATRLSSIEATENVIYTGGSNLLTNGTERSAGKG